MDDPLTQDLARYKAYFEASTSGIFVYDPQGKLIDINPAACRMHGRTRSEMLAMNPREFIAPEAYGVFEAFQDALAETGAFSGEARGLRKDGTRFDVEVSGRLIEIGGRQYLFSSLIDVTQRKALSEQLRHAQRMEAIGQLAGGVAHDFNNLLSVILGYSELVSGRLADDDLRGQVESVISAGNRARDLVQRLLAFSRRQTLDVQLTDLRAFLPDQAEVLRRVLPETITVAVEGSESAVVLIDCGQLEQILLNLAINAKHAMPDGGRLTLELQRVVLDHDYADTHDEVRHGPHALLSVSDTGIGMDPETLKRVFEPFFTTKPRGEGTGLGLSMVYGLIKQHGGHVTVYSESGLGTTFKLYLPLASGTPQEASDEASVDRHGGREGILVVEDNRAVRELAANALTGLGYRVEVASHAAEARKVAAAMEAIDLLLTDVVLPGMNGRQLYRELQPSFPGLRVLYMSGYTQNVITHEGVLEEGVRLINKPFGLGALADAVRAALDA